MRHVIAVANQKGGVAKTTTAINLASGLADRGWRVLLVDLDPQANATMSFPAGEPPEDGSTHTVSEVLEHKTSLASVVQRITEQLDLVPSHIKLARVEPSLASALDAYRLKEALETVDADYDYAVIDCPPSLGSLTTNALVAADQLLVPVRPATFGLSAVADILESASQVQKRLNPNLKILGLVITLFDTRTAIAKDVVEYLRENYPEHLLDTTIGMNVRLDEAVSAQQSIFDYDPRSRGAQDYGELVSEVLRRVER